jgi:hypothetical protein
MQVMQIDRQVIRKYLIIFTSVVNQGPLQESLNDVGIACTRTTTGTAKWYIYFTSARFENLGGIGVFKALSAAFSAVHSVEYEFKLFDNPFALPSVKLPESLLKLRTQIRRTVRGTVVAPPA